MQVVLAAAIGAAIWLVAAGQGQEDVPRLSAPVTTALPGQAPTTTPSAFPPAQDGSTTSVTTSDSVPTTGEEQLPAPTEATTPADPTPEPAPDIGGGRTSGPDVNSTTN